MKNNSMSDEKKDKVFQLIVNFYFEFMKSKKTSAIKKEQLQSLVEKETGINFESIFESILEKAIKNEKIELEVNAFEIFLSKTLKDEELERSAVIEVINKSEEEIGITIEEIQLMQ